MIEKEISTYTLKIIDQLIRLYNAEKIDLSTLQENLKMKLQLLNHVLESGQVEILRDEILATIEKCSEIMG